jgi:uncharacterized membrane protein
MSDTAFDKDKYNFYSRLNQFGEYKYNNRLDTLFVFQLSFLLLLVFVVLSYLNSIGLMSSFAKWLITLIFGSFVLLIFLSRVILLPKLRSTSDWNKMNYGDGTYVPNNYISAGKVGGMSGNAPTENCTTTSTTTCAPQ